MSHNSMLIQAWYSQLSGSIVEEANAMMREENVDKAQHLRAGTSISEQE